MGDQNILPNSIKGENTNILELLIENRFDAIDISSTLVYLVDSVSSVALPYLAEQFDVSYEFNQLTTDLDKRNLIKNAVDLKKYIGTPYAIKKSMQALGYGGADLVEGAGTVGDGHDWARFRVVVDLGNQGGVNGVSDNLLTFLINKYKNARSQFLDISYKANLSEYMPLISDAMTVEAHTDVSDTINVSGFKYDGTYKYNGVKKYRPGFEDLQIQIINVP